MNIDHGNIGDFVNNKILEWKPISFAIEFIYQMRRNKRRLQNIPSTRQAIAIPKLITAMYYRKYELIPDDFIKAAVITTPVEDQSIAREIAFKIIFNKGKKSEKKRQQKTGTKKDVDKKADFMDEFLEIFDSELDMGNLDTEELMDKTLQDLSTMMDFVNDVYDRADQNEEPYKSLRDIIEQRYNYRYILEQGMKDVDSLKEHCHQIILREMNNLSPLDIESAINLNWGGNILDQSTTPWINITAQYFMNHPGFQHSLENVMKNEEVGTSARSLNYLKKAGMDKSKLDNLAHKLVNKVENMMDLYEISDVLNYIPSFSHQKVMSNTLKKDPGMGFNHTRALDKRFKSQLNNEFFNKWAKRNSSPSLPELFQAQSDIKEWKTMLNKLVDRKITEFINNNGKASYNLADLANKLIALSNQAKFESCYNALIENATRLGIKALEVAHDIEQFENVLKSLVSNLVPVPQGDAIEIGKKMGIKEETIIEIFGGDYKLLKAMYQQNIGNFERYTKIMKKIKLNQAQMNELINLALDFDNFQGLGALSHHHMGNAFKAAADSGGKAQKKVAESLNAGPGENLLIQWFYHRKKVPRHLKDFVKKLVKDALIKIALNMISNQRGSGEKGLIPTNQLRPFILGDDLDLINIDASIENIIMQGKSVEMITAEDLLVRQTEKGRVSICFLLDISGSMSGMKLAACSIAVMVLIGSLRADEVAICFFESNTHIVKKFGDSRSLEDVADELLDLRARGGTRAQAALAWGARELEKTQTERKICFLLTDCAFSDREPVVKKELEEYLNQHVQFLLGVNSRSYAKNYAKLILDATQGEIIHIMKIMDIPLILTEALDNIG